MKCGRLPCIDLTSLWKLGYTYHVQYFFYPFLRVTEEKKIQMQMPIKKNETKRKESLKKNEWKRKVTHFSTHANLTCQ